MTPKKKSPAKTAPYHHGDLRAALVRSAVELLRSGGLEALTLRGVARAAGVSQAAPYRHFADRRALVAAVAEHGFLELGERIRRDQEGASGREGLRNFALSYVNFAHEHPAEYRVMFGPEVSRQDEFQELHQTGASVLGMVEGGIARLQANGLIGPGDPAVIAAAIWSMLHGLVMLSLDGQVGNEKFPLDRLVNETTRIMMFGMAARPPIAGADSGER